MFKPVFTIAPLLLLLNGVGCNQNPIAVDQRAQTDSPAQPGEQKGASKAEQAKPTLPELRPLQRFVGSWDWRLVAKPAEYTPKKTTMTYTITSESILRGRIIEHRWVWSPDGKPADCLSLMAYDEEKGQYREWYFDSSGAIPRGENRGHWDEATQTLTWHERLPDGKTSTKVHRFIDNDAFEWTMVLKDSTGKILLDLEGEAKKK